MNSIRSKGRAVWVTAAAVACAAAIGYSALVGASDKSSLEARLQAVEDRQAIEQLMAGDYPIALDSRNWKAYAALFTDDGELVQGTQVTKGPAAIEELFSRPRPPRPPRTPPADAPAGQAPAAPAGPPITKHVVTNMDIKIDGDRAVAHAYWQTVSTRGTTTVIAGAGHYNDVLKRDKGKWKFQHREIVNPLRTNAAAAPAAPAPAPSP